MNAVPPIPQAQPIIEAAQPDASASAPSASTHVRSQDFAAALNDAGGKPARKSAATKPQDSSASGGALPPPGNQPPLAPTPPPPAKTDVAAVSGAPAVASTAAVADAAAMIKGAQSGAQGLPLNGVDGAPIPPANATGATTIPASANLEPPAPPAAAAAPVIAALPGVAASPATGIPLDAGTPSSANGPTATGSGLTMPHAASMRTLAAPGTSTAAAPQLRAGTAQSSDATAKQGGATSANAAPSSADANAPNDSTLNNGPAASGTDPAAQAVMAAAIAQGTSAPAPDSSIDDPASPEAGAPGGAILSDPAAGDPATALARAAAASISAATSAAVTAATAASVAQAVSASAGANAADKRSHGDSPDATIAGASNDGSAGAAQLLTSNTSTDSTPTPAFKIAAGVDTAQFGQGVADRVALMMDGNLTSAKLQVNPPALGPIEVRIALQGGHAQVSFSSHSAVTRDALEASSPKLREMLGSQGFSQVSVDISQRSFQERLPQSQAYESASGGDAPVLAHAPLSMSRSASGLLDAYA